MSHTDKTRPWHVKMKEHPREVHDHRDGVCEIATGTAGTGWQRGQCHFDAQWWRREFRCGCELCGYPSESKKNRRAARKQIAEQMEAA